MRERHRTKAYQLYTADMLFLCAVSLGQQVEQSFSEIMAEYDKPLSQRRHETTLEEAQAPLAFSSFHWIAGIIGVAPVLGMQFAKEKGKKA